MNFTQITQILGVMAIAASGASFLIEGWNGFNQPAKLLVFSGLVFLLLLLGEVYKKSQENLSKIFSSLTLCLLPAIGAQLGSLILDEVSSTFQYMQEFLVVAMVTVIFISGMIWRTISNLGSTYRIVDLIYFHLVSLIFLIPERTSEFHAHSLLFLCGVFLLSYNKSAFNLKSSSINFAVRLSGILIFAGRACLYQVDAYLLSAFYLLTAFLLFVLHSYLENEESMAKDSLAFFGLISLTLFTHKFASIYWSEYRWTILFTEIAYMFVILKVPSSKKIALFFINIFSWISFLHLVYDSNMELLSGVTSLALPIAIVFLSYALKNKESFGSGVSLTVVTFVWHIFQLVKLPVMNMWMVFGLIGIILLALSPLIGSPEGLLRRWWSKIVREFEV